MTIILYFQEQYIFIHEAILETILCGMNEVDSINLVKEVRRLTEMKTSHDMSGFQERFKVSICIIKDTVVAISIIRSDVKRFKC